MINLKDLTDNERAILKEAISVNHLNGNDKTKQELFLRFQNETNRRFWKDGKPEGSFNDFECAVLAMKRASKLNPYKSDDDIERKVLFVDESNIKDFKRSLVSGWQEFNYRKDKEALSNAN